MLDFSVKFLAYTCWDDEDKYYLFMSIDPLLINDSLTLFLHIVSTEGEAVMYHLSCFSAST